MKRPLHQPAARRRWALSTLATLGLALAGPGCSSCGKSSTEPAKTSEAPATANSPNGQIPPPPPPPPPPPMIAGGTNPANGPANAQNDLRRRASDGGVQPAAPSYEEKERARMSAAVSQAEQDCTALGKTIVEGKPLALDGYPSLKSNAKRIGAAAFALEACRAASSDTGEQCNSLDEGLKFDCRIRWSFLRAARNDPNGPQKGNDGVAAEVFAFCQRFAPKTNCAAIRDSVKSGDASRCPADSAEAMALCGAFAWRDPAHCPKGEDEFVKGCEKTAKWTGSLKKGGLPQLAFEGTPEDQILAHSAAGSADACAPALEAFKKQCVEIGTPPRSNGKKGPGGSDTGKGKPAN